MVLECACAGSDATASPDRSHRRFGQSEGPLASYSRSVTVMPSVAEGRFDLSQEVTFRVGIPYVSWLFALPLRSHLGRLRPGPASPWWAPPQRLPARAARQLAGLAALAALAGYLGGLVPATMTYAASEYRIGPAVQGLALGAVQLGSVGALAVTGLSDRRGRRTLLLAAVAGGAAASAAGALSPSIAALTLTQAAATTLLAAAEVLIGVMVIEEMPPGSRAWALALVTMASGLGGGATLAVLPLAGEGPGGWRWLYAIGALALPLSLLAGRRVHESERWSHDVPGSSGQGSGARWGRVQRRRLAVIGAGALLLALFETPAGLFQNQYLRHQRHWSPTRISLAEQVTGTVGGAGTLVGGRLADTHGRRPVAAGAVAAATLATLAEYLTHGAALYGWMTAGSLLGYMLVPALAVYGGELFPTALRGRAGGVLTALAAAGGLAGSALTGALTSRLGGVGPALSILAVAPLAVVVLVVVAYPETARRRLDDLNPLPGRQAAAAPPELSP